MAWWAGKQLAEVLSVPTGHPVRLGEQVSLALLPLPPPYSSAPGPCLGGVWVGAFESSWSCSSLSLPSPPEGKLRPSVWTMELGLGPSMRIGFIGHGEATGKILLLSSSTPIPASQSPVLGTGSFYPWSHWLVTTHYT